MTTHEELKMHLAQALTRADSEAAAEHVEAALRCARELDPTRIRECPACGATGLPEQLFVHDCRG